MEWMKKLKFVLFKQDQGNHFGDINLLRREKEESLEEPVRKREGEYLKDILQSSKAVPHLYSR